MPAIEFLPDGRQACTECDGLVRSVECPRCGGERADPNPVPDEPFIVDLPVSLDEAAPMTLPRPGHGDPGTDTKGPRG